MAGPSGILRLPEALVRRRRRCRPRRPDGRRRVVLRIRRAARHHLGTRRLVGFCGAVEYGLAVGIDASRDLIRRRPRPALGVTRGRTAEWSRVAPAVLPPQVVERLVELVGTAFDAPPVLPLRLPF